MDKPTNTRIKELEADNKQLQAKVQICTDYLNNHDLTDEGWKGVRSDRSAYLLKISQNTQKIQNLFEGLPENGGTKLDYMMPLAFQLNTELYNYSFNKR